MGHNSSIFVENISSIFGYNSGAFLNQKYVVSSQETPLLHPNQKPASNLCSIFCCYRNVMTPHIFNGKVDVNVTHHFGLNPPIALNSFTEAIFSFNRLYPNLILNDFPNISTILLCGSRVAE